jgi:nascent polypeptide-associated complex subunit alpha
MGINVEELKDIERVEIILKDKKIVIKEPQVLAIKTSDQTIYQIMGSETIEEAQEIKVSDEDIEFIVSQTGVPRDKAREALIKAGGDIAEAILLLREGKI